MGVCYYLIREDTRTCFDLGKVGYWREVFGQTPMLVTDAEVLAGLLYVIECGNADGLNRYAEEYGRRYPTTAALQGEAHYEPMPLEYLRKVADRIVAWSEGRLFSFVSDNDDRYEQIAMAGYDSGQPRSAWITGTRFDDVAV